MAFKVCSVPGCPRLQRESKCAEHRRQVDRARGSRQARGYDAAHEAERKRWAVHVDAGEVDCWRCGRRIIGAFDLGHDDTDRTRYRGPEHPACNRATAGR